jgi:hypothetical protein
MAKKSENRQSSLLKRWTTPTDSSTIHGKNSTDTDRGNSPLSTAHQYEQFAFLKEKHNTATNDRFLSGTTSRPTQRNPQKSFVLFLLKRCPGWVPCESLEKFLLEVNLYNLF